MTKPLALLLHEKMAPGAQLGSKLEALDYRVQILADPSELAARARAEMPMIVFVDLANRRGDVLGAVSSVRADDAIAHVPVVAYASREDERQRETAVQAGVNLLATETTLLQHLPQFLEAALHLD